MEAAFRSLKLSARGYHRILRVARTIADLEGADTVSEAHVSEAVCYRPVSYTHLTALRCQYPFTKNVMNIF